MPDVKMHRILIIEDNQDTRRFLESMLGKEFEVISAENGVIGVDFARNKGPDLILLDLMLPVLSGYDTCSLLRQDPKTKHIPIIILSAKNTVTDVTQGLSVGADDYIPKPFDYKELMARIRARLRRGVESHGRDPILVGDLRLDPVERSVQFKGTAYPMTLTEFDILRLLALKAGQVVQRDEILKGVWGEQAKETSDRTIDVHIRAIRKKVPSLGKQLVSIYGVGYKLER